jgi:hypothetical protein
MAAQRFPGSGKFDTIAHPGVGFGVADRCSEEQCTETATASVESHAFCRKHYLAYCYKRLEDISEKISNRRFQENEAGTAGRFLEQCMRWTADVACAPEVPTNLERAQVFDVLLWSSDLHGRLRRSPRMPVRIPILVRSELKDRAWEERTETQIISRFGMRIACKFDVRPNDKVICIRLDTGGRAEAQVAWTQRTDSGELQAGLEFSRDSNFWGMTWNESSDAQGS